jgi:hypothetical protein
MNCSPARRRRPLSCSRRSHAPQNLRKVGTLLAKAAEAIATVLQATVDLLDGEGVDLEEKKPMLLGLDGLRLAEATSISTTLCRKGSQKVSQLA